MNVGSLGKLAIYAAKLTAYQANKLKRYDLEMVVNVMNRLHIWWQIVITVLNCKFELYILFTHIITLVSRVYLGRRWVVKGTSLRLCLLPSDTKVMQNALYPSWNSKAGFVYNGYCKYLWFSILGYIIIIAFRSLRGTCNCAPTHFLSSILLNLHYVTFSWENIASLAS